jgi:hypothetical protein
MRRSVPGVGEGAVIAGMGHKKQKKSGGGPGRNDAEKRRSARAVREYSKPEGLSRALI